jgi:transcriptional regulator with PAS, ATPase and Fis domain
MTPEQVTRFWAKVDKSGGPDACWIWMGVRTKQGYGLIYEGDHRVRAHRRAWEIIHSLIPGAICVCHSCDQPPCCNPAHLWLGTVADNNADRHAKGRDQRGDGHYKVRLSTETVAAIRARYAQGNTSYKKLAKDIGVSAWTIRDALRGESWAHVTNVPTIHSDKPGTRKLTDAEVMAIRQRAAHNRITLKSLAEEFGVSRTTIQNAVDGHSYTHLPVLPRKRAA